MYYQKFFSLILVFVVVISECGYGRDSSEAKDTMNNTSIYNALRFENYGEGYRFEIYINDNPICVASGLHFQNWEGFPLAEGKNIVKVRFKKFEPNSKLQFSALHIEGDRAELLTEARRKILDTDIELFFEFECSWLISRSPNIQVNSRISEPHVLEEYWIQLIDGFKSRSQDGDFLSSVFMINEKSAYSRLSLERLEYTIASNEDDFEWFWGTSTALVAPSLSFLESGGEGLVVGRDPSGKTKLRVFNFLFGRKGTKWGLLDKTGEIRSGTWEKD